MNSDDTRWVRIRTAIFHTLIVLFALVLSFVVSFGLTFVFWYILEFIRGLF